MSNEDLVDKYYIIVKSYLSRDFETSSVEFIKIHKEFDSIDNHNFAVFSLLYGTASYYSDSNYDTALNYIDDIERYLDKHEELKCNNSLMVYYYTLASFCHIDSGNDDLSIYYGSKALDLLKAGTAYFTSDKVIHKTMSISYLNTGEYEEAINQVLISIKNTDPSDQDKMLKHYSLLAYLYSVEDNVDVAKTYFDKCHSIMANSPDVSNYSKIYFYEDISEHFIKSNNIDSAYFYLNKLELLNPKANERLNYLQNIAELHTLKKEHIEAEDYIKRAIQFSLDSLSHDKFKINETLLFSSRVYLESAKYKEANSNILKLLDNLNYSKEDYENVSNIRLVAESLILYSNSSILTNDHEKAKNTILETSDLINYFVINKLISFESKLIIIEKFREACLAHLDFFIEKDDADFIYEIIQRFHGNLIMNELFKDEAAFRFNIPEQYLNYEESLKSRISQREHTLLQLTDSDSKYDSLQQDLEYYKGELKNIINSIEQSNPAYHKLKYSNPPAKSVEYLKDNVINQNSAIIEYFLEKEDLFTFIITKNGLDVVHTKVDSTLTNHIYNLNKHIRFLFSDVSFESYVESTEFLYKALLKDAKSKLDPNINQLYIIPDNEINYIPFSALFEKIPEKAREKRYELLPYIGKNYDISYHYSSALLNHGDNILKSDLSGFAPSFNSDYSTSEKLEKLLYNQNEVLLIKDITDGQINLDSTATLANLRQSFHDYTIAHLATHATCNDSLPFESKIYLEDGPMYAYEIYNMPQNLDLAVLSACQTGDGALKKGEGIMSLARAFISSGCKSVITSLWNANDRSSFALMKSFYQQLWKGKTIGTSLATAKREYLNNTNSSLQAHPYNWATFIAIGNSDMAIFRVPWGDIILLLLLVLITSILFIFILRT